MYIITQNKRCVYGPFHWDKSLFQSFLYKKFNIEYPLPYANPTEKIFHVTDEIEIFPVIFKTRPEKDIRKEKYDGPFYEFDETHAYEYYEVLPRTLEEIQIEVREHYKKIRKGKLELGTEVTINGTTYILKTKQTDIQYAMNGIAGKWKLSAPGVETIWVDLTEEEVNLVKGAIQQHIKECYEWEAELNVKIDSLSSIDEVTKENFPIYHDDGSVSDN